MSVHQNSYLATYCEGRGNTCPDGDISINSRIKFIQIYTNNPQMERFSLKKPLMIY